MLDKAFCLTVVLSTAVGFGVGVPNLEDYKNPTLLEPLQLCQIIFTAIGLKKGAVEPKAR